MNDADQFDSEAGRAARAIRDQIIEGHRRPGDRLVERELAAEFGLSRLPIREALRTLASEGLVTPRPRSWAVVREFTPQDVADLLQVRSFFEPLAFESAATHRSEADVVAMRAAVDAESAAARAGDWAAAHRSGADFHELAVKAAGNSLLQEIGTLLDARMRWMLAQHDDLEDVAAEHAAILSAIEAGDASLTRFLTERHLATSAQQADARHSARVK